MWDHLRVSQLMQDVLSRGAASLVGVFLFIATTISLMRTVVIPRALRSVISDAVSQSVIGTTRFLSRFRRTYHGRDATLAWAGGTIIVLQLLTWLVLYMISYGLLIYGVSGMNMGNAMRESGSSLFTLGFASINTESQTIIDFIAAATGPIVIAMLIGFLPTIYSVYLEREVDVTMLGTTGGEPAWGPEMLARYSLSGDIDSLQSAFRGWSRWAARLRMTHVTYPVLVWVRSARSSRHYIVSLLAVMDAAALTIALSSSIQRSHAFTLLLQGGQAFEILYIFVFRKRSWRDRVPFAGAIFSRSRAARADTADIPGWNRRLMATELAADMDAMHGLNTDAIDALTRGEEHPLALTRADFDVAVEMLRKANFPIDRDLDEAWEQFRMARSRYEFAAYSIAYALDATPAPWTGDRRIPTPTVWPNLAVDVLAMAAPDAAAPEEPPTAASPEAAQHPEDPAS